MLELRQHAGPPEPSPGCTLSGTVAGMEKRESLWATIVLRPSFDWGGQELFAMTYRDWDWRFACPRLRPGKYVPEVSFYTKGGDRTVILPAIEVDRDRAIELAVPPDGE